MCVGVFILFSVYVIMQRNRSVKHGVVIEDPVMEEAEISCMLQTYLYFYDVVCGFIEHTVCLHR